MKKALGSPFPFHPEPEVFKVLKGIKGEVFVDVGANIGIYSFPLSKNFKRVYAVEPNPQTLPRLRQNLRSKRNVAIFDMALSNAEGEALLYVDQVEHRPNQALGSADTILSDFDYRPVSRPEINQNFKGRKGFKVACRKFDSVFKEAERPSESSPSFVADLVKIDVEGAEFLVLEGMKESLSSGKIKNLLIELHDRERKRELENLVSGFNYWKWIDPDHLFCSIKGQLSTRSRAGGFRPK